MGVTGPALDPATVEPPYGTRHPEEFAGPAAKREKRTLGEGFRRIDQKCLIGRTIVRWLGPERVLRPGTQLDEEVPAFRQMQ